MDGVQPAADGIVHLVESDAIHLVKHRRRGALGLHAARRVVEVLVECKNLPFVLLGGPKLSFKLRKGLAAFVDLHRGASHRFDLVHHPHDVFERIVGNAGGGEVHETHDAALHALANLVAFGEHQHGLVEDVRSVRVLHLFKQRRHLGGLEILCGSRFHHDQSSVQLAHVLLHHLADRHVLLVCNLSVLRNETRQVGECHTGQIWGQDRHDQFSNEGSSVAGLALFMHAVDDLVEERLGILCRLCSEAQLDIAG
mmetsp:Transcript_20242/g.35143  ORF Transcript_20242/g.35143 Transcript_20242/m.35143 type:complete len:254 (+) Transcript_20242:577-1338(+)